MTIYEAFTSRIDYPRKRGFYESVLIARGLCCTEEYTEKVANSKEYIGALADGYFSLLTAIDFSESDISVSLPDRNYLLKMANYLYSSIGEKEKSFDMPIVRIGLD